MDKRLRLLLTPLILLVSLTSCSIFSGNSSLSLPLPLSQHDSLKFVPLETSDNPNVYKLEDGSRTLFLTSIKNCGGQSSAGLIPRTRQLLVGLRDLRIQGQKNVMLGDHAALASELSATLDQQALKLIVYSTAIQKCGYDFVLWQFKDSQEQTLVGDEPQVREYLAVLIQHLTSVS